MSLIDDVRNYWDAKPCNINHSGSRIGSLNYYNEVEDRKYRVESHILRFADFDRWRKGSVLEIGCGIGTDMINFARSGAWVYAVDISALSLKIARERAKVMGVSNRIKFGCDNAEDLTPWMDYFQNFSFDLIYSFGVLHHIPNYQAAIVNLSKFASQGTTLKIMVYNRWSLKNLMRPFTDIKDYSEAQPGCPVTHLFSKRQIRSLLKEQGWHVEPIITTHIFPYKIAEYKQGRYKKHWYFEYMPNFLFKFLERQLGWHLLVTGVKK